MHKNYGKYTTNGGQMMWQPPAREDKASHYETYLLTCRQERDEAAGMVTWRFKLETPQFDRR